MIIKKLLMLTAIISGFSFVTDSGNCDNYNNYNLNINNKKMYKYNTYQYRNNIYNNKKRMPIEYMPKYIPPTKFNNNDEESYSYSAEIYGNNNEDYLYRRKNYDNEDITSNHYINTPELDTSNIENAKKIIDEIPEVNNTIILNDNKQYSLNRTNNVSYTSSSESDTSSDSSSSDTLDSELDISNIEDIKKIIDEIPEVDDTIVL